MTAKGCGVRVVALKAGIGRDLQTVEPEVLRREAVSPTRTTLRGQVLGESQVAARKALGSRRLYACCDQKAPNSGWEPPRGRVCV